MNFINDTMPQDNFVFRSLIHGPTQVYYQRQNYKPQGRRSFWMVHDNKRGVLTSIRPYVRNIEIWFNPLPGLGFSWGI